VRRRVDVKRIAVAARQRALLAPAEAATAMVFISVAAVAMFDSRQFALIDTSGRSPGGLGAGFYPFWAATVVGVAGLVILYRALNGTVASAPPFESRDAIMSVGKLVGPMLVATAALSWLGFYLCCGLYMGYFARFIGRYRWVWVAVIAVAFPVGAYLGFEMGLRLRLPKSVLYELGLLF
jgi:putative tricarboxylic transport membrane protein